MIYKTIKTTFDPIIALLTIFILLPFLILIFIILALSGSKSKVMFTQTRIGEKGFAFQIMKFKTMTDDTDSDGKLLPDELRMTKIGSLLRKSSLDEVPQLFNILAGDMSFVGPRPLLPKYIPLYSQEQLRRHNVKPGITGWAQVNGRNNITWQKKFELDVWYIDNVSFILDIKILWLTLKKVINRNDITSEDPQTFAPFNGKN